MTGSFIDARTSLALAIHANPGVYAMLLGSGVSRSAGIPTGWEVMSDIIRRIASASGEDCEPDPCAWHSKKCGTEPTYSAILEAVGSSQAERSRLLKSYFEPSEDESGNDGKKPTRAHTAIAGLVRRGLVRVILTTNFDRLIERALEDAGVSPTVISTPEAVEGALPLVHSDCTVVKLHGDYLDLRTRNTLDELDSYDSRIDLLLYRVLDEYGLIVCGWSGDWDMALRKAMERRKGRRFTTWWTCVGDPSEEAKRLISLSKAQTIAIDSADEFFDDLAEKLSALETFDKPHPVSAKIAVALTKKYVSEPRYNIQLHDLLMREVEKIARELAPDRYSTSGSFSDPDYAAQIQKMDALSEIAVSILATGCFWDKDQLNMSTWTRAIARIANAMGSRDGNVGMLRLGMHAGRLCLYAAGVANAARDSFAGVYSLLSGVRMHHYKKDRPLATVAVRDSFLGKLFNKLPGPKQRTVAMSDHYHDVLRPAFREILPDDIEFTRAFDLFEVLQSFFSADENSYAIPSAFMYRTEDNSPFSLVMEDVKNRIEHSDLLSAGFCKGDMARFDKATKHVQEMMDRIGW